MEALIRYKKSYIVSGSSDGLCAVWAPFSSVGTPMIKYKGFKGESFHHLQLNRMEETVLCVGSNYTVAIWNIKDGTELYKLRSIKTARKSTIVNCINCFYQLTTPTTILGMAKDSTVELIETNLKALMAPKKGTSKSLKKNSMVYIRTLFDLNSFVTNPSKSMKIVDASSSSYKPY